MFTHRYNDHTESTYLKKSSTKKIILDTCTKTAFSLYNVVYEIKDGTMHGFFTWACYGQYYYQQTRINVN